MSAYDRFRRARTGELVAARPDPAERAGTRLPVRVLLDDVRSASNVGLVFRLCDCLNVEALWLGGITPFPGISERASERIAQTAVGGSLDEVAWRHLEDPVPAVRDLQAQGWRVVAVEQGAGSVPWNRAVYALPTVLILGHERKGVRDGLLALADEIVELPVRGITNSLNVALCAAAVLYELLGRQSRAVSDARMLGPGAAAEHATEGTE